MNKRQTKLFDLKWDLEDARLMLRTIDRPAILAHALWIVTEGTQFEEDAKAIIESCCPAYFKNDDEDAD